MMDSDVTTSIEPVYTVEHDEPLDDDVVHVEAPVLSTDQNEKSVFVMNFQELANFVDTIEHEASIDDMQKSILDMNVPELEHLVQTSISNQSLQWDDSPEQYELSFQETDPDAIDMFDPIFQSTPLFPELQRERLPAHLTDSHDDSLTSEETDPPVFFQDENSPIPALDQQFNRVKGVRNKKITATQNETNAPNFLERVLPIPNKPDDVRTTQAQILSQVLPLARPEAVVLGPQAPVQNIGQVLDVLQGANQNVVPQLAPADTPTRRPRAQINYKTFHSSGQR